MTAPARWAAVVDLHDGNRLRSVEVGTYATEREALAAAHCAIVRLATPVAVEVTP